MKHAYLFALGLILFATQFSSAQIYVNQLAQDSIRDGSTWDRGFELLEDAIEVAMEGDEIWVALGIYSPPLVMIDDGDDTVMTNTYIIDKNIKLYGGFLGFETSIDERNTLLNITLLEGDIDGDDKAGSLYANKEDNSLHLIYVIDGVDTTTTIDGFYLFRGAALLDEGLSLHSREGGGIYMEGTPTIRNCIFQQCSAVNGGSLSFEGGTDNNGNGFGHVIIEGCSFDIGGALDQGGAIYIDDAVSATINTSRISRNISSSDGTIYLDNIGSVRIANSVITENSADAYAGVYASVDLIRFERCEFSNNLSDELGVIQFEDETDAQFVQTRVINNRSDEIFAGVAGGRSLSIVNSEISNNTVFDYPEFGQVGFVGASLEIIQSTIGGPVSPTVFMESAGAFRISNSIIFSEEDNAFMISGGGSIQSLGGNICSDESMNGILLQPSDLPNTNPQFKSSLVGNYKLEAGSPAIDASFGSTITEDVIGFPRTAIPDIGAYEFNPVATTQTEIPEITVSVTPTIATDYIQVESDLINIQYHIVDMKGRILKVGRLLNESQSLNVSSYPPGQYQIIFRAREGMTTRSFLKQ